MSRNVAAGPRKTPGSSRSAAATPPRSWTYAVAFLYASTISDETRPRLDTSNPF